MPLNSNNIITTTNPPLLFPLSLTCLIYNMYMNQAWIWQPTMGSNHNHHCFQFEQEQDQGIGYRKEHMFEKPLTPSDVGKLNRLVIPKQHAEKHFPLDSESGEKGLLLSFEDESGKSWNFRYSYWTSSQSYVLTKGWSRYVKEKKLDAGDVVLFERCRFGSRSDDRFYIGCRRRVSNETATPSASVSARSPSFYAAGASTPYAAPYYYMSPVNSGDQAASSMDNTAAVATTGNSRRLRLFGVNLECGPDPEEPDQHLVSGAWNQFMPTNASTSQL